MANQIVVSAGAKVRNLQDVIIGTSGVLTSLGFDVANGVPRLDVNGKILVSQLPNSVMEYKGTWNISTNTPTLVNGTGNQGDVYLVEGAAVGGTAFNFGAGPITFFNGDQAIYSGSIWQRASGATGTVTSVAVTESGDSLNITGSPITTSGTINIGFNGTNLQYVNGAGNLTTFPTLITSIGLSMPSAFSVANSPLTANGTIAVTGAGTTAQYIRGDGSLATFPTIATEAQRLITEVYNETGATLTKGTVVYINGGQGNLPTVTKAIATGDATSAQTYGIVQTDITNMNNGYVVVVGSLMDLDTQAYAVGTQLYLSSTVAGQWTSVKQYAPAHLVYVAIVVRSHPTQGVVEVRIQNGFELDELHNVSAQTPSNNDGIFYNSTTSLWESKSIATALGYTPANDASVVHLAGTETITGEKTFTNVNGTQFDYGIVSPLTSRFDQGIIFKKGTVPTIFTTITTNLYSESTSNNLVIQDSSSKAKLLFNNSTQTYTFPAATGTIALTSDIPSLTGYVPYTGATTNVNLGVYSITTGSTATFSNASSLSAIFSNGGAVSNYNAIELRGGTLGTSPNWQISKDNSTGNAFELAASTTNGGTTYASPVFKILNTGVATFTSSVTATSFVKTSGTSSQFLKADGSVDSSTYLTTSAAASTYLPLTGGTLTGALNINLSSGTAMNVAGNAIFRGDTGVGTPRQLIITSGGSTPVYLEAKGYGANYQTDFGIKTFNSAGTAFEVFYADSSGRVGINRVAPSYQLDVNGTGRFEGALRVNGGTTTIYGSSEARLNLNTDIDGEQTSGWLYADSNATLGSIGYVYLQALSTTVLSVLDFNNYGNNTANGVTGNVFIGTSVTQGIDKGAVLSLGGWTTSTGSSSAFGRIAGRKENATSGNQAGYLSFETANALVSQSTEKMRITSTGNIGIGTSTVTTFATNYTALNINAATGYGSGTIFKINNVYECGFYSETGITTLNIAGVYAITGSFGTAFKVASGGNVLIGTSTDNAGKLQVNGEIRMYGSTLFRGMSSNTLQLCGGTSSSNVKIDGSVEVITMDTNGATRLTIASTGAATFTSAIIANQTVGKNGDSGTIANGVTKSINLNSFGGNLSAGYVVCSSAGTTGTFNSVIIVSQIHTNGANTYSTISTQNDSGLSVISLVGTSIQIINNSGVTLTYNCRYINFCDANTWSGGF